MSRSVFTPWPDKPLRMVDVMIIISIALGGSQKDTLGRWNAMGLSRDSVEECSLHNRIIQTALYSVLSRFTLYLLKLLCISATWEESLSVFWAYPEKLGAPDVRLQSRKTIPETSVISIFSLITWLHNRTVQANMSGLPFPQKKLYTSERLPRHELAHVAQLISQWTGGWAWCHPMPCAASLAPYKDLTIWPWWRFPSLRASASSGRLFSTRVGLNVGFVI